MAYPLIFRWDGEAMAPLPRFAKEADRRYVIGESYRLDEMLPRSRATHNHYFASVEEGWANLPEEAAERFPTSEHLRKYALIKAGFADQRSIVCASKAEAQRVGGFIKPMDEFAVVTVSEAVVTVYTAKSQSIKAMGAKPFQASKQAVLDVIAGMIGVSPDELERAAA